MSDKFQEMIRKKSFTIAYFLYVISLMIGLTTFKDVNNMTVFQDALRNLSYIFLVFKIFIDFYGSQNKRKFICVWMIFMIPGLIVTRITHSVTLLTTFAFMLCAYQIDFEVFIKKIFVINIVFMLITIISSCVGIIPNLSFIQEDRIRYSLGFTYPSHLASFLFFNILIYIFIKKGDLRIRDYLICELLSILCFCVTDARMGLICTTLVLFTFFVLQYNSRIKISSFINYCLIWSPIIFSSCITFLSIIYHKSSTILLFLNQCLNGRLGYAKYIIGKHGIDLFGNYIEWHGWVDNQGADIISNYNFVDISYVKILANYGIIVFIFFVVFLSLLCYKAYINKNTCLQLVIFFICMYSVIEPRLIELHFNPFILLLLNQSYLLTQEQIINLKNYFFKSKHE